MSRENVDILSYAISDYCGTDNLQLGKSSSKESLIEPTGGGDGSTAEVEVRTIENVCSELGIDHINLLKVEGEGVEPEILKGVNDIKFDRCVVSCTPERNGKSPIDQVIPILESMGLEVQNREQLYNGEENIAYACRPSVTQRTH